MDEMTDHGPMIILGAPFLRQYAVAFDRTDANARRMGYYKVPTGSSLCTSCDHTVTTAAQHASATLTSKAPAGGRPMMPEPEPVGVSTERPRPLGVSMARLRFPTLLGKKHAKKHADELFIM
eukprot:4211352-Prymnesium_polylepis.1